MRQFGNIFSNPEAATHRGMGSLAALLPKLITLEVLTPRYAVKTGFELLLQAADALQQAAPLLDGQTTWAEFRNKLQCFYLFAHVDSALNLGADSAYSLLELTTKAARLDPYRCVFATEGVGHYYGDRRLANRNIGRSILNGEMRDLLPAKALVPLHAGMGLSLAEAVLSAFEQNAFSREQSLVARFIQLCQLHSMEGYFGATFEAIGLAAQNLFPHLIPALDSHLLQMDENLSAYFWHGIGRAIYFSPTNFLPLGNGALRGLQMCLQGPPHSVGRLNAVAGFAWAMTLVNIRQPEIIAQFLQHHEQQITESAAFINGICSAMVIWHDSAPGSSDLDALACFTPVPPAIPAWTKYVVRSCAKALEYYQPLKRISFLEAVFRYQTPNDLLQAIAARKDKV